MVTSGLWDRLEVITREADFFPTLVGPKTIWRGQVWPAGQDVTRPGEIKIAGIRTGQSHRGNVQIGESLVLYEYDFDGGAVTDLGGGKSDRACDTEEGGTAFQEIFTVVTGFWGSVEVMARLAFWLPKAEGVAARETAH